MAVAATSSERALRQPARVDGRKVAGLFIFCVAVVGGLLYWQSITDLRPLLKRKVLTGLFTVALRDREALKARYDDALDLPVQEAGQ